MQGGGLCHRLPLFRGILRGLSKQASKAEPLCKEVACVVGYPFLGGILRGLSKQASKAELLVPAPVQRRKARTVSAQGKLVHGRVEEAHAPCRTCPRSQSAAGGWTR